MSRNFRDLLEKQWSEGKFLCVGLDPDYAKIPQAARERGMRETLTGFGRAIVDATKDIASCYKPNSAFYEEHGDEGWEALRATIRYILDESPATPVILDAKRGDIGNTNAAYTRATFDHLHADAVTVHPYFGSESLTPFLERKDKGIIVMCRSSNKGGGEIQDLQVGDEPLYLAIARIVASSWNEGGNCGVMVGATYPDELANVRAIVGDIPILIPGIGAQSGDVEKTLRSGKNSKGNGMIICASRSILFASNGPDFADAARAEALKLDKAIRAVLQ